MSIIDNFRDGEWLTKQVVLRNFIEIALGKGNLTKRVRALRAQEEQIELSQAMGLDAATVHALVDHVYSRPVGRIEQEIGGVMVTIAVLCDSLGFSMNLCYETEGIRLLRMDTDELRRKNKVKEDAGFSNQPPALKPTVLLEELEGGEPGPAEAVAPKSCTHCRMPEGQHTFDCPEQIPF